mgnify:CR=1 FL=1
MKKIILTLASVASIFSYNTFAQTSNVVSVAVPFLLISPDARAGGMADQGVATLPDANSIMWNTAKLNFAEKKSGISVSYAPWLENLVSDVNIMSLTGYYKLSSKSAVTANFRFFSLGDITFQEEAEGQQRQFNPNELNFTAGYALKLSRRLSGGINIKYIRSQLTDGQSLNSSGAPGTSVAADVSAFYKSAQFDLSGKDAYMTGGINIANIGGKMNYDQTTEQSNFLPTNMRLGAGLHVDIDNYNAVSFSFETMKLLVPTNPFRDSDGNITSGKDPNVGVIDGIFQSFTDSPDGESELQEFTLSLGAEYLYKNQFAFRGGLFLEDKDKGNRKYATLGAGLKLEKAAIDFSYLIPTTGGARNPLQGTLRFSINFSLDAFSSNQTDEEAAKANEARDSKKKKKKKKTSDSSDKKGSDSKDKSSN